MRRRDKKKFYGTILAGLLLLIGLGYALLSSNLNINGTSKIANSKWDIHFNNIQVNSGSVPIGTGDSAAIITPGNNTEVTYNITLNKPGDFYEFTVDVVNNGTIDGMVDLINSVFKQDGEEDIIINSDSSNIPNYLKYSITYSDGAPIEATHLLKAGQTETYKVRLEFKRDIANSDLPEDNTSFNIVVNGNYKQKDETAKERPPYYVCTYDGELTQGAEYVNGQYTYTYNGTNGWSVVLTDKESTDPVTTRLCTIINDKPIVSMQAMFNNSKASSIDLSSFNTSNVTDMTYMFNSISVNELDLSNFDMSKVNSLNVMLASNNFDKLKLDNWDLSNLSNVYNGVSAFLSTNIEELSTKNWKIPENFSTWMQFWEGKNIEKIDVTNWDLSKAKDLSYLFFAQYGSNLTSIKGLDTWDVSNVTKMNDMFDNVSKIKTIDLSSWNPINVTTADHMFYNAHGLEEVNISNWNTSNLTNITCMFMNTTSLIRVNMDNWDLTNNNSSGVFNNSTTKYLSAKNWIIPVSFTNWIRRGWSSNSMETIDVTGWDLSNTTNISGLFADASKLSNIIGLTTWDTSHISNMSYMFYNTQQLSIIDLSKFNLTNLSTTTDMFNGTGATTGYARTQADANILNASSGKPNTLTFTTK